MDGNEIIFPAIVLAFVTIGIGCWMGRLRFRAAKNGELDPGYFKFNRGAQPPDYLLKVSHNYDNLLALPVLFYTVVIFISITGTSSSLQLALAWAFVVSRVVHSAVHTTINRLRYRFYSFVSGVAILLLMWLVLLIDLL